MALVRIYTMYIHCTSNTKLSNFHDLEAICGKVKGHTMYMYMYYVLLCIWKIWQGIKYMYSTTKLKKFSVHVYIHVL